VEGEKGAPAARPIALTSRGTRRCRIGRRFRNNSTRPARLPGRPSRRGPDRLL